MKTEPKVIIPIDIVDVKECLYKLYYGQKFIIVMAKSMYRSVWSINDDIKRYHKGINENYNKSNLYSKFYRYILDNPVGHKFSFEILLISENPYQLLKLSQIELDKAQYNCNCLNSFFIPYINPEAHLPFYKQRKKRWWVNKGAFLNFCKFRKKMHGAQKQ